MSEDTLSEFHKDLVAEIEDGLVRTNFKLRAMLGYKVINDEGFKLRLSAGPSYDVLMSVDNTEDNIGEGRFSHLG